MSELEIILWVHSGWITECRVTAILWAPPILWSRLRFCGFHSGWIWNGFPDFFNCISQISIFRISEHHQFATSALLTERSKIFSCFRRRKSPWFLQNFSNYAGRVLSSICGWLKAEPTWLSDIQYGLGWSSADRKERGLKTGLLAAATLPPYPAFNLERLPGIFVWERQLDRRLHVIKCRQTLLPVLSTVKTTLTSWAASLRGWGRHCQCYSSAASCRKVHCRNLFQGRLLNIGGKFPP